MSETPRPVTHALRAVEELLLSAADSLALLRERDAECGRLERSVHDLADQLARWAARGEGYALRSLRAAVRAEARRWEFRAGDDPAAGRVHDLFAALDDVLGDDDDASRKPTAAAPPPARHGGRRTEPR